MDVRGRGSKRNEGVGDIGRQVWAVGQGLGQDTSGSEGVQDSPGGPRVSRNTVCDPDKPNMAVGLVSLPFYVACTTQISVFQRLPAF